MSGERNKEDLDRNSCLHHVGIYVSLLRSAFVSLYFTFQGPALTGSVFSHPRVPDGTVWEDPIKS